MVAQGRYPGRYNARPFIRGLRLLKQFLQVVLSLYLALACSLASAASVVFLNPGHAAEPFWADYSHYMQDAAGDLGIDLRVIYGERDTARILRNAHRVLEGEHPDYLIFVNEQFTGPEILRLFDGTQGPSRDADLLIDQGKGFVSGFPGSSHRRLHQFIALQTQRLQVRHRRHHEHAGGAGHHAGYRTHQRPQPALAPLRHAEHRRRRSAAASTRHVRSRVRCRATWAARRSTR